MSLHLVTLLFSALTSQVAEPADTPQLTFVESPITRKHVAIQPRRDHHRIHILVRASNLADKRAYASVHCHIHDEHGNPTKESVRTVFFTPTNNNQLFAVYLRAPKFATSTAKYEIHLGEHIPNRPDICVGGFRPLSGFAWEVARTNNGHATFHPRENQEPFPVNLQYSIAIAVGGQVRVESRLSAYVSTLKYGVDRTHDQADIDGNQMVRALATQ